MQRIVYKYINIYKDMLINISLYGKFIIYKYINGKYGKLQVVNEINM